MTHASENGDDIKSVLYELFLAIFAACEWKISGVAVSQPLPRKMISALCVKDYAVFRRFLLCLSSPLCVTSVLITYILDRCCAENCFVVLFAFFGASCGCIFAPIIVI